MPSRDSEFYQDLRRHVSRAVSRLCSSWLASERDDIIQTSMLRLHQVFEPSEGEGPTRASSIWKTAFSVTIDEIRRRSRRPETPLRETDAGALVADGGPSPERRAMPRQLGEAIRHCLAALSEQRRSAVVLHLQGHAVPQIAALLGWNAKKAENLVYRSLADVRTCLAAKGIQSP